MNFKFEDLAIFVVAIFGLFGAIFIGTIIHEYSHAYDFKDLASDERICGLVLPKLNGDLFQEVGYYSFIAEDNKEQDVLTAAKYTEIKAYSLSFVIIAFFLVCLESIFKNAKIKAKNL